MSVDVLYSCGAVGFKRMSPCYVIVSVASKVHTIIIGRGDG